jgi:hypothetical protein
VVADSGQIAVGLRVATVGDVLSKAAVRYLTDVRLHLRPNVVVRRGNDVAVSVGPVRVTAGSWELAVTILRVDATLSAESIELAVTGTDRLDVTVPVHVGSGTGEARIEFGWDAARATGLVCGDFVASEVFSATVEPRTYRMRGSFTLVSEDGGLVAKPTVHDRIAVSPVPTPASWNRVRQILQDQNRIFNCGLALSPSSVEEMLRDLLARGFRFSLPSSILRQVPLPGSILNQVEVAGRRAAVSIVSEPPLLMGEWIWLRASVAASVYEGAPITVDAPR